MMLQGLVEMVVINGLWWVKMLDRLTSLLAIGTFIYSIVMLAKYGNMDDL